MRVPHFWLFTLGLSATLAIFGCSRESSVKENVNLKNNHSRVFAFKDPIPDPQAFADSMANTAVMEADTIPDTLTVTVNDSVYLIAVLPYFDGDGFLRIEIASNEAGFDLLCEVGING